MKFRNVNSYVLLLMASLPGQAYALKSDRDQPIMIEAEQVEIDEPKGYSRYQGKVKFVQGSLVIRGSMILLYHKDGEIEKAIIHGSPASFQQIPDKGEASIVSQAHEMEYIASKSRLFLFKSARVAQGNNSFAGEKIEYDIINSTVVANKGSSKGGRVRAVIEEEDGR